MHRKTHKTLQYELIALLLCATSSILFTFYQYFDIVWSRITDPWKEARGGDIYTVISFNGTASTLATDYPPPVVTTALSPLTHDQQATTATSLNGMADHKKQQHGKNDAVETETFFVVPKVVQGNVSKLSEAMPIMDTNEEEEKKNIGGYDPSKILYLNVSDASVLKENVPSSGGPSSGIIGNKYSVDILTVGSILSIKRAEAQLKTFGSHVSRRHYWLATEFDDPDPSCASSATWVDVRRLSNTCKGRRFWSTKGYANNITSAWRNGFARLEWLEKKANPVGWACAQRRFTTALSKLMVIYREGRDKYGIDLPDYLIFGDDDTYVNMELLEKELIRIPNEQVKEKNLSRENEESDMKYPTQNTPVVYAGCRVRSPRHVVLQTFPFGGYGTLFSKAAINRFIEPLYCGNKDGAGTGWELKVCEYFTPQYQSKWGIGALEFFRPGMSVSDLMGSYSKNFEPFCLHSDWAIGYFVNHFYISRHTVPTAHLHTEPINEKIYWYNDHAGDVKHDRLHAWHDGSEIYNRGGQGNCQHAGKACSNTSQVCHQMTEHLLNAIHQRVKPPFPGKCRDL